MKKKKLVIIAPTGMLGSAVYHILQEKYELVLLYRNEKHVSLLDKKYGGVSNHTAIKFDLEELYQWYVTGKLEFSLSTLIPLPQGEENDVDAVINCAGVTKPHSLNNPELTFFINGAFPHLLSEMYGEKLIQIATDCVFDGNGNAPYTEKAAKLPADLYGLSKSLGEPYEKSLVLRTSIIGEELHGHTLLIGWLKQQKGDVFGFPNHWWNGITTNQFAHVCDQIISNRENYPSHGLFHIFSNDISKYELLYLLKEKYQLPVTVKKKDTPVVDRRLRTKYSLNDQLHIPSTAEMIAAL